MLVGYGDAVANGGSWRWVMNAPGVNESWSGTLEDGVHGAADVFVRNAVSTRRLPEIPVLVEIEGVPTLKEYARAVEILGRGSAAFAACSWPNRPDRVRLHRATRGGGDVLQSSLGGNSRWSAWTRRRAALSRSPAALRRAPMLRHLPNFICLVRIALIWPTIDALYAGRYWTALILVAVCAVSDGLDGWLAKRFNWTSQLGKILDPLADKLLLVALFLTATWMNLLPWWLTAGCGGARRHDRLRRGDLSFLVWTAAWPAHLLSKINTGMQLAVALAAILGAAAECPLRDGDRAGHRHAAHHHRVGRRLFRLHTARTCDLTGPPMRQLILGVQLKERATFASSSPRATSSWWRTCAICRRTRRMVPPGSPVRTRRESRICCRRYAPPPG